MAKQHIVHAAAASGLTLFILPALADEDQGITMTLGVEQRFEAGDNLALERPEEGSTALSTTSLTFGLLTETQNQSLSLTAGAKLREGSLPSNSDLDTGIVDPSLQLRYRREAANAEISVDGSYRQSDISFTPAVSDFTDDAGDIVLPEDFDELQGSGTRTNYNLNARLVTGRDAPLGFVFEANTSGISYDQQTATLEDTFRYGASARANLRFNGVTTGFASYAFDHYETDDPQDTERDTHLFEVGVVREVSERATVEAAIGFADIDESVLFGVENDTTGATGRILLTYLMPDGVLTASYSTTQDQNGARHNVRVGRSLEFPRGLLSASIGATQKESGDPDLIGSLRYIHELPTGSFLVSVNRDVSVDSEDDERITTTAEVSYNHDINSLSSLGLDFSIGSAEGTTNSTETTRADVTASYNRELTEDWTMSTGVSYRVRDQEGSSTSDSTSVFLTLKRDFTLFR